MVKYDCEKDMGKIRQDLIEAGRTGMVAGAGFMEWAEEDLGATKARVADHLRKLEEILPTAKS